MDFVSELWLAILLSAVFVFVVSSILHMLIPMHSSDYKKLDGEEGILEALRAAGVKPGTYVFPGCESMKEMNSPEMKAKYEKGPIGFMTVIPGFGMGKSLVLWFVMTLVVGVFVAYLANLALVPGADYRTVFRVTGCAAFMAYAFGSVAESIWKGQSWVTTGKFIFDSLLYALVTAGTFGWLWPDAELPTIPIG
jgi:hypothetical protein